MYNQTTLDWLLEAATDGVQQCLTYYEIILTTMIALVALLKGRNFWMNVIHGWMLIEGVMGTIFPEKMLSLLVVGTPDAAHLQLMRFVGILILFSSVGYFLLSRSTDSTVQTSLIWGMTVFSSLSLLALAYIITHPTKKSPIKLNESMASPFYSTLVLVVVTAYFALKSTDWGGYSETPSHANLHLRLEFLFLMVFGVFMYALPQWVIRIMMDVEKLDGMHTYLARCAGAFLIMMGILCLVGPQTFYVLLIKTSTCLFIGWQLLLMVQNLQEEFYLTVALYGAYDLYMRSDVTWQRVGLQAGGDVVLVMNATGALNIDPCVFNRVLVPRIKACYRDTTSLLKRKQY